MSQAETDLFAGAPVSEELFRGPLGEPGGSANRTDNPAPVATGRIAYITDTVTLAGDVIATGTPAGVGVGMRPPRFFRPGDICEVEVEGIGPLPNPIGSRETVS